MSNPNPRAEEFDLYVCPTCKGDLDMGDALACRTCAKIYYIHDGIPDFLGTSLAGSTHPVLRKLRFIDKLAPMYETKLWYPNVLRLVTGMRGWSLPDLVSRVAEIMDAAVGCVVDVACGPGTLGRRVANHSRKVYGIDVSLGMLKRGTVLACREHVTGICFARSQAEEFPFRAEAFGGAICSGSLHLFADPDLVLCEIARTLKSNAPLALVTFTSGTSWFLRHAQNYALRRGLRTFEIVELERMLLEAEFRDFHSTVIGSLVIVAARKR